MNHSESIKQLAAALSLFQSECDNAPKTSDNPFFKSKYANLTEIWATIDEPLAKHGLSVAQVGVDSDPGTIAVETILLHNSGEWISGVMKLKLTKDDPQGAGSAITYARRYGLAAILGVTQEDDDANSTVSLENALDILHAKQAKAYKAGVFTDKDIKDFNTLNLGVPNTKDCKSLKKVVKAMSKFNLWELQRICGNLGEEVLPQVTHRKNYYKKADMLGVDDPYACVEDSRLERTILDLKDRKANAEVFGVPAAEADNV